MPQHWQPNSGLVMTNDVSDNNPEEAVPCIALSKNDSYVMSACGGKVSLFNMMTFKVINILYWSTCYMSFVLFLIYTPVNMPVCANPLVKLVFAFSHLKTVSISSIYRMVFLCMYRISCR